MMPKMSENVLSYTMNSRSFSSRPATLGMMMALLMIDSGMAYTQPSNVGMPMDMLRKAAMAAELPSNANSAMVALLTIKGILSRVKSNSSAASSTMNINPMVPSNSRTKDSNGMEVRPMALRPSRKAMPMPIKTKTLGMFVRFASRLAK